MAARPRLQAREANEWLEQIARSNYSIAGDLCALVSAPGSEGRRLNLPSYRERLGRLRRDILALESDIKAAARRNAARQAAMVPRGEAGLKLNLGSGFETIDGWVSLDAKFGDVIMNLLRPLPFREASVDFVFMSHVLEHFHYPYEAFTVLSHIRRVLKPGGALRIVVPDIRQCLLAYAAGDREFLMRRDQALFGEARERTLLEYFLNYAGAAKGPDGLMSTHKFGYDADTLAKLVGLCGFDPVPSTFMGSAFPQLRIDCFSHSARAEVAGRHLSLFMDAVVPA
ncbi:MAG TPA: methyltransferase domain-containing protein [Acetobacteraceae bacterium]|nr:methyltransferase domain-containing protein [Acetobacteraceae bacterium]